MRWIGSLLLLAAVVVGGFDGLNYLRSGEELFRPIGAWWYQLHSESLLLLQPAIERYILPALWDPVVLTALEQPLAVVLAVLGIVLLLLARRRGRQGHLFR